ncbi:MAG: signal recognition particle-docking protein FtsY [Chloroflexi bacterium]|nr:signal recognition particle-docking protein FtsY [Chloroflexota bacterium]
MILDWFRRRRQQDVEKTTAGLQKTRQRLFTQLATLFERTELDAAFYDDLEAILIGADIGVETTGQILAQLRAYVDRTGITRPADARDALRQGMMSLLQGALVNRKVRILQRGVPYVVLVVGVNGTGKTTTIAKLVKYHQDQGRRVLLAAGDTFRAAAIDQLKIWADRLGTDIIAHAPNSDPGAVVFDAARAALSRGYDVLIVDTAGRLHTKFNLMEELRKLRRILQKHIPEAPQEVVLVIDATTGQNGLVQAQKFAESVEITDLALVKLDGTARGGIAFAVAKEMAMPISYIGTGETVDDFAEFDAETFVNGLFGQPAAV